MQVYMAERRNKKAEKEAKRKKKQQAKEAAAIVGKGNLGKSGGGKGALGNGYAVGA